MSTFNTSMFQSIKDALNKPEANTGTYTEIMKTTPGNTYTVRLLPNSSDPKNTFFEYISHGWESFATGQYVQAVSPQTFGDRDPIAEERFRILRTGSEDDKEKVKAIRKTVKYLVNVYVIDDPSNPENNGKVKILRYGKQLQKIIIDAISGDDADEFGPRIFDLGPDGANFKVKCETQGDYPTYVSSRFTSSPKLTLSDKEKEDIYNKTHDLTKVFSIKSADELKQMFNEHYLCNSEPVSTPAPQAASKPVATPAPKQEPAKQESVFTTDDSELDLDELLKDL